MRKTMHVGFVGLGDQGGPMACAVADAGWPLHVWARRTASLEAVGDVAHEAHASLTDLGAACDVVLLCLRDDDDLEQVVFRQGMLDAAQPGLIVVNHGTGSPERARELEAHASELGVRLLDAPVSGGGAAARARSLTVMVGGDPRAFEDARPVFASFGAVMEHLGAAGAGQRAKLMNNLLFTANLRNLEEALELADGLHLDVARLLSLIAASSGGSRALELLVHQIPVHLIDHNRQILGKDVAHFSASAREAGVARSALEDRARDGVEHLADAVRRLHEGPVAT